MNSLQALEAGVYLLNILHRLVNQNRFFSGQVLRPRSAALQLVGMLLPWAQSDARYGPSMVHQASAAVTASQLVCIYIYKYIYTILHYFMLQYYILRQIYIYSNNSPSLSLSHLGSLTVRTGLRVFVPGFVFSLPACIAQGVECPLPSNMFSHVLGVFGLRAGACCLAFRLPVSSCPAV